MSDLTLPDLRLERRVRRRRICAIGVWRVWLGTVVCEMFSDFIRKRCCACEPPAQLFDESLETLMTQRLRGLLP